MEREDEVPPEYTEELPVPQVVRPHVETMEDLAWNPARLAEFERQERLGISEGHPGASPAPLHQHTPHAPQPITAQRRRNQAEQKQEREKRAAAAANRTALAGKMVERAREPHTQTPLPQMSAAQRRRNQADQPRERTGKYAEKPPSKWRAFLSHEPAPKTNLKKVGRPHAAAARSKSKKSLPSKMSMLNKPVHQKVGWVVKRWLRRKKRLLRALFSWKG